jgi:hypothetical protein
MNSNQSSAGGPGEDDALLKHPFNRRSFIKKTGVVSAGVVLAMNGLSQNA